MDINRIDEVDNLIWDIRQTKAHITEWENSTWEKNTNWLVDAERTFPPLKESSLKQLRAHLSELEEKFAAL